MTRRRLPAGMLAGVALAVAGCGGGSSGPSVAAHPPAPTVVTSKTPERDPQVRAAARLASVPAPGTVTVGPGPFVDRVKLEGLRLERGARPVVRGRLKQAYDVSEMLDLTLAAAFYDANGRLLGTGLASMGAQEEAFDRALRFSITANRTTGAARSAVVTIPSYVPE